MEHHYTCAIFNSYVLMGARASLPLAPVGGQHWSRTIYKFLRTTYEWIGLRENLQESSIFNGKIYESMVSGSDFPLNQSIEYKQLPQGISPRWIFSSQWDLETTMVAQG